MNAKSIKNHYSKGLWNGDMVRLALDKGVVTQEEFDDIVGDDVDKANNEEKFNRRMKRNFDRGLWHPKMLEKAVSKGKMPPGQFKKITGRDYE